MSKSIYEEALDILLESLKDPLDERRSLINTLNYMQINKITKAIRKAQKQEKLLGLYRELMAIKNEIISLLIRNEEYGEKETIEIDLEKRIKELENDI